MAASELAGQLAADGFVEVTPRSIESWRSRGLLGKWQHVHPGGAGSVAVPAPDAAQRARVAARLAVKDRTTRTVTLLALATGAPVDVDDVRRAVTDLFEPVLVALKSSTEVDGADRADAYLSRLTSTRRGGDALRRHARKLAGAPDPQRPPFGDRSPAERAHDAYSAVLAAVAGDPSWISQVLPDALRLSGMHDLAHLLESEDLDAHELGFDVQQTVSAMLAGLARLGLLGDADIGAVQAIFAAQNEIVPFAASTEPFVEPDRLAGAVANVLLSQLAFPGQLRDGLLAGRSDIPPATRDA